MNRKVILNITPQTNVRATQGDRIFFRIPREKLRPAGLKRLLRLERYNQYKIDLLAEAKAKHFTHPEQGGCITFYIPMPRTWRKFQKKAMAWKLHQSKPDLDNLLKAYFDALLTEDKGICHYEARKVWVDFPVGWIEVSIKEPEYLTTEVPRSIKDLVQPS